MFVLAPTSRRRPPETLDFRLAVESFCLPIDCFVARCCFDVVSRSQDRWPQLRLARSLAREARRMLARDARGSDRRRRGRLRYAARMVSQFRSNRSTWAEGMAWGIFDN